MEIKNLEMGELLVECVVKVCLEYYGLLLDNFFDLFVIWYWFKVINKIGFDKIGIIDFEYFGICIGDYMFCVIYFSIGLIVIFGYCEMLIDILDIVFLIVLVLGVLVVGFDGIVV